jgi:hypothetical protein
LAKALGFELPRSAPSSLIAVILALSGLLVGLSFGLQRLDWGLGLPNGSLEPFFTTMWQVQAGIAALALPILIFVVERSRDDPRAAFRSPDILLRDSYAYHIMAFSFIVVGHIGIDQAWFGTSATVAIFDLTLLGITLVLAMYAYFKVVQLLMSSSLLQERSVALAKERLADEAWRTGWKLTGADLMRRELDALGVQRWTFEPEDPAIHVTLSITVDMAQYLDDVDLNAMRRLIERLPRKSDVSASTDAPSLEIPSSEEGPATSSGPVMWYLMDFGGLVSPPSTGFLRLRRDAFDDLHVESLQHAVAACVHLTDSHEF